MEEQKKRTAREIIENYDGPAVRIIKAVINGTPRHVYVCTRCLRSGKVTRAI